MANILVSEDEILINNLICKNLKLVGHKATPSFNGEDTLDKIESDNFDLILLDIMLPSLTGFDVKEKMKKDVPVIFVTAKDSLSDKLKGLGLGADDYIVKPFEILELLARVESVLRRTHKESAVFRIDAVKVELRNRKVYSKDQEVCLTPREFDLLETLIINKNLALSRDKLLDLVWGYDFAGDTRTVDVHIQKLRSKLHLEERIETVYKMGYRLNAQDL